MGSQSGASSRVQMLDLGRLLGPPPGRGLRRLTRALLGGEQPTEDNGPWERRVDRIRFVIGRIGG